MSDQDYVPNSVSEGSDMSIVSPEDECPEQLSNTQTTKVSCFNSTAEIQNGRQGQKSTIDKLDFSDSEHSEDSDTEEVQTQTETDKDCGKKDQDHSRREEHQQPGKKKARRQPVVNPPGTSDGRPRRFSVREVVEMVCLPDGALSDTESTADEEIDDPDFEETPEAYESDSSLDDDEPLAATARANPNHLDVEIHNIHADSDTDVPDDDEPLD
ncbi:hypothetical protein Q8A67_006382 [Cirrhinus molitorella]|uniref:Uncharacterized protein n=1 Tax=Cirrhinus molitorella TaxID=172907 RepID=A0AA88Q4Z7_9TELE|nr:hypothetical protein Q8A67_006382 [Cirrhinus molitorella]